MGCGASKSSKVVPAVIDAKPQTTAPVNGDNADCPRVPPVTTAAEPQSPEAVDQSAVTDDHRSQRTPLKSSESAIAEHLAPGGQSTETVVLKHYELQESTIPGAVGTGGSNDEVGQEPTSQPKTMAPVAFEVDMRPAGSTPQRTLPPRRLASLESVPKLTTEELLEKQKQAEQRRLQKLEERKNSGLPVSKKDKKKSKLMKDIIAARELQENEEYKQELDHKLSSSDSDGSERSVKREVQKAKDSKDEDSVEMEVDDNFNAASSEEM